MTGLGDDLSALTAGDGRAPADLLGRPGALPLTVLGDPVRFTIAGSASAVTRRPEPADVALPAVGPVAGDVACGDPESAAQRADDLLELTTAGDPRTVDGEGRIRMSGSPRYVGPGRLRGGVFAADLAVVRDGVVVSSTAPSDDGWYVGVDVGHGVSLDVSRSAPAQVRCTDDHSTGQPLPPGDYVVYPVVRVVGPHVVRDGEVLLPAGRDVYLVGEPSPLTVA